MTEHN